jgi:2-hydroxy-6-oxonona-2,4-dienedioate hydrolase
VSALELPVADSLDKTKIHVAEISGIPTRYYDDGQGDALVLISGGSFGSLYSLDSFSLNFPELTRHFRVIAIDKPGQGHTPAPLKDEEFTHDGLIAHTIGLLDALGIHQDSSGPLRGTFAGRIAHLLAWH